MTRFYLLFLLVSACLSGQADTKNSEVSKHRMVFDELASRWDEAVPMGNGMVGQLVWQKNGKLRFSLDRADLWDLRPMANIDFSRWKFSDVYRHWKDNTYGEVQKVFDEPYGSLPAPSKIPAGALEFDVSALGKVLSVELALDSAFCRVRWENGASLTTFVHASEPVGWYRFSNLPEGIKVALIPPAYNGQRTDESGDQSMSDLNQLGYAQGKVEATSSSITYDQQGYGDFSYRIHTQWKGEGNQLTGCWSVSSSNKLTASGTAVEYARRAADEGYGKALKKHLVWWSGFWNRSSLHLPDQVLEHQYYLELYKFGSAARPGAPPISLQAVWTADNGQLPPWKGDFHHDLNTQLSYWPAYTGNQLQLEEGFINWLWTNRETFRRYTRDYFGTDGMNVPGVTTLEGEPMGGWIQFAMGPAVGAWLGQHFYLHWKYTMDNDFLKNRAYPWVKDVAIYLEQISEIRPDGKRSLPISSSPEIYNNSREAWFGSTTNFDLAQIRWTYAKAAEMASVLGLNNEAERWTKDLSEWPGYAVGESGLLLAPGYPYNESHRHLSHLLAIHPLGNVDDSNGSADRELIRKSLETLEQIGPDYWVGYSYSWLGNLYARAFEGDKAAETLKTFATCFCLKNSFHVNGDQSKSGKSKFTYRPFTLEGNFAFAAGVQEMLIQSHTGRVVLFPAIPNGWDNVSFHQLRTYGAFLVSASRHNGSVSQVSIRSEKGGTLQLQNPFNGQFKSNKKYRLAAGCLIFDLKAGESVQINSI